jgi:hypothetical protein
MEKRGVILPELLVISVIILILVGILYPALRPRLIPFTRLHVSPLRFKDAELQYVMGRLDHELRRYDRLTLQPKHIRYEEEQLKGRKITLVTDDFLPLRDVFKLIEQKGQVDFQYGSCGTCGGLSSSILIRDISKKPIRN